MEQHSGTQEAAGLPEREAAAAAERPNTTVRWYVYFTVQTRDRAAINYEIKLAKYCNQQQRKEC